MAEPDVITFYNRYTQRLEQEQVYGAAWMRWTYCHPFGRLALAAFVKRPFFSQWYGWRMNRSVSRRKIRPFIRTYGLDPNDFAAPPESFRSFNEFFYRRLKPEARPVDPDPNAVIFPADARHLGFPDASQIEGVFVKGQRFDLTRLLGDGELAQRYARGAIVLSRLCPVDYHRFHFPVAAKTSTTLQFDGPLYSVNPIALRRKLAYLWENRRTLTVLTSAQFGTVLMLEIGATNVGSIVQTFQPGTAVAKGDEKGYFQFGGSSTLLVFEPGRIQLADDLVAHSRQQTELYARIGDRLGVAA